ncbi:hypothetical protein PVAND_016507 [Polypedilum vanderplanki]|uniref:Uncharacterized protein n=1 Tax=Polypedilum vanderplanki TaxID=319348 RepID=A0A9J6BFS9_POLVA|nr:hypothetical protein PVAND_016507 [Polypedilum vanderplanki]
MQLKIFQFNANLFRQVDNEFIQIFKSPSFEWCSIVGTKKRPNPITKIFIEPLRKKFPALFQCPLIGNFSQLNFELDYKMMMMLPASTYKIVIKTFNKDEDNIVSLSVILKV